MKEESTESIYSSMERVWPENDRWYDYTHRCIIRFILSHIKKHLKESSIYMNAGSGGSVYDLPGQCIHVDIAENLIKNYPNHVAASIESLPFPANTFDATICVGSVLNYCDAAKGISELARTLKTGGYLILEYERSNTAELWGSKEYGKGATIQKYEYMGHTHTLFLYSERIITELLRNNGLNIIKCQRFHCVSALINRITGQEESAGRFGCLDKLFAPFSYFMAHNAILLCKKGSWRL